MAQLTTLDANQVTKYTFDAATSSVSTVTASIGTTVLLNAVPAQTNVTSAPVSIRSFKVTGIVVSWSGLDHVDGTIQFQGSVDGTFYDNIGSAATLASASGHQSFSLIDEPYQYFHIVYSHGTNTTGTVSASYFLRS